MNKFEKLIMVVPRDRLLGDDHFEGFAMHHSVDFRKRILENYEYRKRGPMEEDPGFKQPVGYCLIVNPAEKKVFVFQRAKKDQHYTEKRLQGKWSCGVGGHVDKEDADGSDDPLWASILRELDEEVNVEIDGEPEVLGYINSEHNPVSQVHFGVLCLVRTTGEVTPNEPEIANGGFRTIEELEEISGTQDMEQWSRIAIEPLKEYFNSL